MSRQLFGGDRLFQEVQRTQSRRPHRHIDMRLARHHDDGRGNALRLQFLEQGKPVFVRHDHVGNDQIERLRARQIERLGGVIAHRGFVTGQTERAGKRSQRVGFVVNDQ